MVATMAYRDTAVDPIPHVPDAASVPPPPDWRRLCEQTLERAEAAEARAEELKWAEAAARGTAGSLKWQFKEARRKRLEAVEDANQARRAAKNALALRAEVARLTGLLGEAGVDPHRGGTEMSLRREVHRLRKAVPGAKAQAAEIDRLHKSLWKSYDDQARLRHLPHEALRLHDKLKGRYRRLRAALKRSVRREGRAEGAAAARDGAGRGGRRVAQGAAPVAAPEDRAQRGDEGERPGCVGTERRLRRRTGTRETEIAKLRATRAVLSKALYGRRSEMRERSGSGRPRGQVRGAPGHGSTPRPGLEERVEEHNPPDEARIRAGCGKPYAAVGAEESALVEIEVRAHRRVIRRTRWRRTCGCASSPAEVSAPPVPRLFPNTAYGTSVWSRVLYERYACRRPVQRVGAWLSDQGLPVSAGTLADSAPRFVPLFEPLAEAIRAHQNESALRQADETGWRVQALRGEGRSGRA